MPLLRRLRSLGRNLLRRDRVDRDLDREIEGFLQDLTDERLAAGMPPEAARREARLALGGAEQVREEVRAARAGSFLDTLAQDLRFGARMLRRAPAFTAVAVVTLALGIGAVTSIFSVVHAILLRPLPYPEPDRLVLLRQAYPQRGLTFWRLSQANFLAYLERSTSFEAAGAYTYAGYNASGGGEPARVQAAAVSADLFAALGARAALGRTFLPGEDRPGRRLLVLLSDGEWRRRFGGDPGVLGRTLLLDNVPAEIIGVMPQGFDFPNAAVQVWTPLDLDPSRTSPFLLLMVARLRPGVTPQAAQQETTGILTAMSAERPAFAGRPSPPEPGADLHTVVRPLDEALTSRARAPLLLLFAATGLLLLIGCANVANLVLARSTARAREIAVRFALGATAARVGRQLLTELLLLGALGGAAGLLVALPILAAARRLPTGFLPRLEEVRPDPAVLAAAIVSGLAAAILAGLLPALRLARGGAVRDPLQARGTPAPGGRRASGALVGLQFALSLLLLVGSGLLLRSLHRLMAVDPGFDPSRLMTLSLDLPPRQAGVYANPLGAVAEAEQEGTARFYDRVVEAVRAQPGIGDAALASSLPFGAELDADMTVCEGREGKAGEEGSLTLIVRTSPGFFRTLGLPLRRGRDFTEADRVEGAPVAIVDETLAAAAWPGEEAVGRHIRYGWDDRPGRWKTIVGVVAAVRDDSLDQGAEPHMYIPFGQEPMRRMGLVARSEGADAGSVAAGIRAALRSVDATVPAFDVRSMEETMGLSLFERRFTNLLLGAFAATALLLAAAGIYGVMSLEVASRFKEIAVRMALGARPGSVFGLVLRHGATLAAAGMAAGLLGSLAMTRLLSGLLFEIRPSDPPTLVAVVLLLGLVALLACAAPARRATRIDPITALRQD